MVDIEVSGMDLTMDIVTAAVRDMERDQPVHRPIVHAQVHDPSASKDASHYNDPTKLEYNPVAMCDATIFSFLILPCFRYTLLWASFRSSL